MKNRVILSSLVLSLFLLLSSCGIPNWFYISSSDARILNSTVGTDRTTTITVESGYDLDIEVFLLYTIHNATGSTTPTGSTIRSGLTSDFRSRYRINDANANRFSSSGTSIAEYTYTSTQHNFNLYSLKPMGTNVPTNSGSSPLFKLSKREGGAMISSTIDYELVEENGAKYLKAVLTDSDGRTETMTLARFNSTDFSVNMSQDSQNDHTSVESGSYSLYVWPVMYISSSSLSSTGYPFNNLMLVTSSDFLKFEL